jgi:phage-related holin
MHIELFGIEFLEVLLKNKVFSPISAKVTFRKIASLIIKMVVPVSHKMKPIVQTYCLISKGAMFSRSAS